LAYLKEVLGIDPKAARAAWTVFLLGLAIFLVYAARRTLLIFALALFFAYMLTPVLNFVQRIVPARFSRNVTLAIVYVLFLGAIVGIGFGVGTAIAEQATNLVYQLPDLVKSKDPLAAIPFPEILDPLRSRIVEGIRAQVASLNKEAFPLIKTALASVAARAGSILEFVLVPILGFFFLKDGTQIRQAVIDWTTTGRNSVILDEIFDDVHVLLGHYIRALVILSACSFIVYSTFLQFSGGQYAVLLGGVAAVLEFIPVVGPLAAGVIIVIVEGATGYSHLVLVVVFLLCYRLFQDYVLSPYLMGAGVELHPLLVLFGVLAGEQIAGIPGMFFSVPVIAALRIVYVHLLRSRIRRAPVIGES
jgi:predicted PurR-regulated permease PerM